MTPTCAHCGTAMRPGSHGSPKRYCKPAHRLAAWKKQRTGRQPGRAEPEDESVLEYVNRLLDGMRTEPRLPEPLTLVEEIERTLSREMFPEPGSPERERTIADEIREILDGPRQERDPELFRPVYPPRRP